mmetsp:Transcript_38123/g.110042  ORF Transcript_38123/g.110042 Transcript_38123/m.110042 type:complete len:215 (-) Transcript_38123:1317-1961(-)
MASASSSPRPLALSSFSRCSSLSLSLADLFSEASSCALSASMAVSISTFSAAAWVCAASSWDWSFSRNASMRLFISASISCFVFDVRLLATAWPTPATGLFAVVPPRSARAPKPQAGGLAATPSGSSPCVWHSRRVPSSSWRDQVIRGTSLSAPVEVGHFFSAVSSVSISSMTRLSRRTTASELEAPQEGRREGEDGAEGIGIWEISCSTVGRV